MPLYREKIITFNINVDSKTLRKIKNAEKKVRDTEDKIKKHSEAIKRDQTNRNKPINTTPIGAYNLPQMGIMPMNPGMPLGSIGPVGAGGPVGLPKEGMMPRNDFGGYKQPPMMGMHMMPGPQNMPGMLPPQPILTPKQKIEKTMRDKQQIMNLPPQQAKRFLNDTVIYYLE